MAALILSPAIRDALQLAHPSWRPALHAGLDALHGADPAYLPSLEQADFLPSQGRLFAAFAQPLDAVRYVLVGEGPYPREESATGFCFMDGAVGALWSDEGGGLSKEVNRATSLRNFIKMLLVASGDLSLQDTGSTALTAVASQARLPDSGFIQTLADLQKNLSARGFLLLNASLVFRPEVAPAKDAKAWQPFLNVIFSALNLQQANATARPTLVLWGKIAEQLNQIPAVAPLPKVTAEHPYNLSFIGNQAMQNFFGSMQLLAKFPVKNIL